MLSNKEPTYDLLRVVNFLNIVFVHTIQLPQFFNFVGKLMNSIFKHLNICFCSSFLVFFISKIDDSSDSLTRLILHVIALTVVPFFFLVWIFEWVLSIGILFKLFGLIFKCVFNLVLVYGLLIWLEMMKKWYYLWVLVGF